MTKIVRRTRAEVYRLWVDALRSKKYRQARGALRDGRGFCCLGVLCDLARKDGGPAWGTGQVEDYMSEWCFLPDEIASFVELSDEQQRVLVTLNDDGATFKDIADYIETKVMPRALR